MNPALRKEIEEQIQRAGFSIKEADWLQAFRALISTDEHPVNHFGLMDAALKQPQLIYRKPETLSGNVARSAALLGLTREQFAAAALKQPSLFYQKPETLSGNVARSAALLGLTREQFIAAALKQPTLFYQKPETLSGKKDYVLKIMRALGETKPFAHVVGTVPAALSYSTRCLHARYVIAKLQLKRGAAASLVVMPRAKASALIVGHLRKRIACTGKGTRALQVMHAQGLIETLPDGIEPIERPPHYTGPTWWPRPAPRVN